MDNQQLTIEYSFTSLRLGFRPLEESDLDSFAALNADEEVMKFFPNVLTTEQTQELITSYNEHIAEHHFGFYAVDLQETQEFVGIMGLKHINFDTDFTPAVEIGWRFHKKFWSQGLATEGAKRCLRFGFNVHQLHEIYSFTALVNEASERVMQNIGMTKISEFKHPKLQQGHNLEDHCLYKITKQEFLEGFTESTK